MRNLISYAGLVERGIFNNRTTLYRAMKLFGFPAPYKLGRRTAWDVAAVEAWLNERHAQGAAHAQQSAA